MPGVRGGWEKEVRWVGSVERRQERERTPARRMSVPRAIWMWHVSQRDWGRECVGEGEEKTD